MNILGIDYGSARVGVALGNDRLKIASPYIILDNKDSERFFSALEKIIKEESIEKIITGIPYSLSSVITAQTESVKSFVSYLEKKFPNIEIIMEDERFSTRYADSLCKPTRGGSTDDIAAMIILQSYFDKTSL